MLNDERRKKILELLIAEDQMRVSELIGRVDGSPATIRRDLTFLEKNGYIIRTHGSVKYVQPEMVHTLEFSDEILAIAKEAAKMVNEGDTILMDSGVTTLALANHLIGVNDLTVITNSIPVASLYSSNEHIQTYITGGYLKPRENALVGNDTIDYLTKIHAPKLFLSTTGVRAGEGLTCVTPFQADVKRAMIEASDEVILLATAEKLEKDALRVFATFDMIDVLVTTEEIRNPQLKACLDENHVRVVIA